MGQGTAELNEMVQYRGRMCRGACKLGVSVGSTIKGLRSGLERDFNLARGIGTLVQNKI